MSLPDLLARKPADVSAPAVLPTVSASDSVSGGLPVLPDTLAAADSSLWRLMASYYVPIDSLKDTIFAFRPMELHSFHVHRVAVDTVLARFHDRSNVIHNHYPVGAWLGNLGLSYYAPVYYMRDRPGDFMFTDHLRFYLHDPASIDHFCTRTPYTLLQYSLAGGSGKEETRTHITHTQNVNENVNLGFLFDSNAADGQYAHQTTGNNAFTVFGSYRGSRYQLYSGLSINKIKMKENGGLTNLENFYTTTRPANVYDTYTTSGQTLLHETDFSLVQSYAFTRNRLVRVDTLFSAPSDSLLATIPSGLPEKDSLRMVADLSEMDLVPVYNTDFSRFMWLHTLKYTQGRRNFKDDLGDSPTLYPDPRIAGRTDDMVHYSRLQNTFELMLQEQRRARLTAGFSAGILNQIDRYDYGIVPDTVYSSSDTIVHNRREFSYVNTAMTGRFFNHTGHRLNWDIESVLYVAGHKAGAFEIDGDVQFHTYAAGQRQTLTLGATLSNEKPGYFLESFSSNHYAWDNQFDDAQHIRLRAVYEDPARALKVGFHMAQLNKLIYFDETARPDQTSTAIVTAAGTFEKDFRAGKFHFLFNLYGQYTSEDEILPLPAFTGMQTTYFDHWLVPGVLHMHLGYDIRFFTAYYAYAFMPATGVFHLQREDKVGNYPFVNAFVDFKLKRMHISIMGESLNTLLNGTLEKKYFTVYRYPLSEARVKVGLSWAFYD